MQVIDLSKRLLAYVNYTVSDDFSAVPGVKEWLVDAIMGALCDMRDAAPGLFTKPKGGVLKAVQTVNADMTTATPNAITLASSGIVPNDLCSVRIVGMEMDATILDVNDTAAKIAPAWEGAANATAQLTVWHDAWDVCDPSDATDVVEVGTTVKINGIELEPVGNRESALSKYGSDGLGRRLACSGNDVPRCWWIEQRKSKTFIMVYPMPVARVGIEARVMHGFTEIATSAVLSSTETFNLPEDIARDIWRPLAVQRFAACPLMANKASDPQIAAQAAKAMELLNKQKPKARSRPAWNCQQTPKRGWEGRRY